MLGSISAQLLKFKSRLIKQSKFLLKNLSKQLYEQKENAIFSNLRLLVMVRFSCIKCCIFFRRWHKLLTYPLYLATFLHLRTYNHKVHRNTKAKLDPCKFHRTSPYNRVWWIRYSKNCVLCSYTRSQDNQTWLASWTNSRLSKFLKLWPIYGQSCGWYHRERNNFALLSLGW